MNSFFQTWVHPDNVHLTAITTPFGLYKWTVMLQGPKNVPPIHQRWMNSALRHLIGKICLVYLDNIVIWSNTIAEHIKHIDMVMKALANTRLFCNKKKCNFFLAELNFLRHHISAWGIEPNLSKVQKILHWPTPATSTSVCAFLGLIHYIAVFLPKLADYTHVLTPLMKKDAKSHFSWSEEHQATFNDIKALIVNTDCLTVINHTDPDNKFFIACDASNWWTSACLSFGKTWETSHPVAYDSMQLSGAEKNYPIHKKELLAIIWALKKWCTDLIGAKFVVYTDHCMLENFNTQCDLSHQQLHWQEFTSQYEMKIVYIRGEDNCVADMLSCLPNNCFPDEHPDTTLPYKHWKQPIGVVLSIKSDRSVLSSIKSSYNQDVFCQCLSKNTVPGAQFINRLWYICDRLIIPQVGDWPFRRRQILCFTLRCLLLTQHVVRPGKGLCTIMHRLSVQ